MHNPIFIQCHILSEHPVQVRSLVQDMSIVLAHQRRLPFTACRTTPGEARVAIALAAGRNEALRPEV